MPDSDLEKAESFFSEIALEFRTHLNRSILCVPDFLIRYEMEERGLPFHDFVRFRDGSVQEVEDVLDNHDLGLYAEKYMSELLSDETRFYLGILLAAHKLLKKSRISK